jgi:hypothetical protein
MKNEGKIIEERCDGRNKEWFTRRGDTNNFP